VIGKELSAVVGKKLSAVVGKASSCMSIGSACLSAGGS